MSLALSRLRATRHAYKRDLQQQLPPEHTEVAEGDAARTRCRDTVADLLPGADDVPEPLARKQRLESHWVVPTGATPVPTEDSPHVLGVRVQIDARPATESRGAHMRLLILCPFRKDRHHHPESGDSSFWCKSRAIGPRTASRFGELEPWAFLGCWVEAAERCSSRLEHQLYSPTAEDIAKFIRERGWA